MGSSDDRDGRRGAEPASADSSRIASWLGEVEPVVRVEHLNHSFGKGDARNQVLFDNSLTIGPGQLVVMTGPSGSDKTTLLTLIGALRKIQEGEITVLGRRMSQLGQTDLVKVRRDIGFIFQLHNLFESLTSYENVKMAMQLGSCREAQMHQRGVDMLSRLGLSKRVDYMPRALSGGQCQCVAIARALVNRPRLLLADEPTASFDKDSAMKVVQLFQQLVAEDEHHDGDTRQSRARCRRPHRQHGPRPDRLRRVHPRGGDALRVPRRGHRL
jgi:putative ABC transport system ATP-binding protein